MDIDSEEAAGPAPKAQYGRIVRDEDGNVIDIIIEEVEEDEEESKEKAGSGWGAPLNPEEESVESVSAKTEVVKGELRVWI
jgi:nucleolar protein 16